MNCISHHVCDLQVFGIASTVIDINTSDENFN